MQADKDTSPRHRDESQGNCCWLSCIITGYTIWTARPGTETNEYAVERQTVGNVSAVTKYMSAQETIKMLLCQKKCFQDLPDAKNLASIIKATSNFCVSSVLYKRRPKQIIKQRLKPPKLIDVMI